MPATPLISIIVPSFNQAGYIRETLQSLLDQNYPTLEVIIQDGGSTDGATTIAEEYARNHPQVFQLFVEKDNGQADALNRGFARTKGDILGFLNSDDTLYPGCLQSVAREINPSCGRFIVFGRCLFTGKDSPYVGVEHPAEHKSHFEFLAIWKRGFNTMPQPSVFWHRSVWAKCGSFNIAENHALDYDLFCRFSAKYAFHRVDELWSTYRMHGASKSAQRSETEVLDLSIGVSRRYWGGWWSPLRWRCEVSYWLHNRHLHEHARHHARRAEEAGRAGRTFESLTEFFRTAAYSPRMARDRLLRAWLAAYRLKFLQRLLLTADEGFTGHHGDGWIGPVYRTRASLPAGVTKAVFILKHTPQGSYQAVTCVVRINGKFGARHTANSEGHFALEAPLTDLAGKDCVFEIKSDNFFVPRDLHNAPDDRKLSVQLLETKIEQG